MPGLKCQNCDRHVSVMLHRAITIADKIFLCKPFVRFMLAIANPGKPVWKAFNLVPGKFESCVMQKKMSCILGSLRSFLG